MPAKSHDSSRTTAEWVVWAKNEGFDEIEETIADKATPGKVRFYENISQGLNLFVLGLLHFCVALGLPQRLFQSNSKRTIEPMHHYSLLSALCWVFYFKSFKNGIKESIFLHVCTLITLWDKEWLRFILIKKGTPIAAYGRIWAKIRGDYRCLHPGL
jgi:hypothetical protein